MTISVGDRIPATTITKATASGPDQVSSEEFFKGRKVALIAVPGAFTPTCHVNHLPGFLANQAKLKAAGVTRIVCASVNDHHVMKAWAENTGALGQIDFLADGSGAMAKAFGLQLDLTAAGMGPRFARSAVLIRDGVVQDVFVEDGPGVGASGAPAILMALEAANS